MVERLDAIWLDGQLVPWDEARVHLLTHSLHYGLGAFEGIRAYRRADGRIVLFRLMEHIERLFDTCKTTLLSPRVSREQMRRACIDTVRATSVVEESYVRPLVFRGEGAMAIYAPENPVRAAVAAWEVRSTAAIESELATGIRVMISSFARPDAGLAKAKVTGLYVYSVLAKHEAKLAGYDEAILLDAQGHVVEGAQANLFIVKNGVVHTPDLGSSIVEGITRATILTIARELNIEVVERRLTRAELWLADEAFLTGTASHVLPIREVDGRAVGTGGVGPITRRLQSRFFGIVRGDDDSHPEWLTSVPSHA